MTPSTEITPNLDAAAWGVDPAGTDLEPGMALATVRIGHERHHVAGRLVELADHGKAALQVREVCCPLVQELAECVGQVVEVPVGDLLQGAA